GSGLTSFAPVLVIVAIVQLGTLADANHLLCDRRMCFLGQMFYQLFTGRPDDKICDGAPDPCPRAVLSGRLTAVGWTPSCRRSVAGRRLAQRLGHRGHRGGGRLLCSLGRWRRT